MKTAVQPLLDTVEKRFFLNLNYGRNLKRKILYELEKEKRNWV